MSNSDTPIYDPLTGAYSRALLADQLRAEVERVRRYGQPCSLLVFDLDHFKSVNDAFGHARGDAVLAELARRVQQAKRGSDQLFRYGGDEFVVLLPSTSKADATRLAERLLVAVRDVPFGGGAPLSLSLSIGVATCPADADDPQALFERADARNYLAKRRGRACVVADDRADAPALPFADIARLIERDTALVAAREFLDELAPPRYGALRIAGPVGAGRSRFLAAVEQQARLQGFAVLSVRATSALRARPYGALLSALPTLAGAPGPLSMAALFEALHEQLGSADRLLIAVDDLPDLDWGSLDLLRQLLGSAELPALGVAYTTPAGGGPQLVAPAPGAIQANVQLRPISPAGLRVWLRVLLQWEPPDEFVEWLAQQTYGLPANVERALRELQRAGALTGQPGGWQLSQPVAQIAAEHVGWHSQPIAHNLPVALTSLIGRERDLAEVRQLLATTRLLTLAGPGGMGKTRLALQLAADVLGGFADGVWLVELASLSDPALAPAALAASLGLREEHGRPLLATLIDWLRTKQLLLVLDNCEHLVDACAQLAVSLLADCEQLRIVASSREPLGCAGEQVYRVPPLAVPGAHAQPTLGQLADFAAARLFIERAIAAHPGFSPSEATAPLIGQICAQLDGIPLAIELAAARARVLSVAQIAKRLDDRLRLLTGGSRAALPRHQTLRALIDWSYALLSEGERALLRRLAVFVGGWSLEAAEAVACLPSDPAGIGPDDVRLLLDQLANKSLIVRDEQADLPRYRMLETIRQYARERLLEADESELIADAHLGYYIALAERCEPIVLSARRAGALRLLETEIDNLRAALEWACAQSEEAACYLAGTLAWFWYFADHLNEGRSWLVRALALGELAGGRALAKALSGAGLLAGNLGNSRDARAWLERAIVLWRALGGRAELTEALFGLAYVLVQQGDDARAALLLAEHEELLRADAPSVVLAWSLNFRGRALLNASGDVPAAKRYLDEGLAVGIAAGDAEILGDAYMNLGHWAMHQADYGAAQRFHAQALAQRRRAGARLRIAVSSHHLANVLSLLGEHAQARPIYAEALAISRALGDQAFIAWTSYRLGYVAAHQGAYGRAREHFAESLRLYRAQREQELITSCLAGCAELWRAQGQPERAASLLGYAQAHPQSAQRAFVEVVDALEHERTAAALADQLGNDTFERALAAGRALSLDQAIALALG